MIFNSYIWEQILGFLPLNERVTFRLLSKSFDGIVLKTVTELYIGQDYVYGEEMVGRFGSHTKHLFFDACDLEFKRFPEFSSTVNTITLGDDFDFFLLEAEDIATVSTDDDNALTRLQKMNLKNLFLLRSFSLDYFDYIFSENELNSLAFTACEHLDDTDLVFEKLNFRSLKLLSVHAPYYEDKFCRHLEEKAKELVELELVCPGIEEDFRHSFPKISSLKIIRFCLNSYEDTYLCLNNPIDLPNLRNIDVVQEDNNVLDIRELEVWPLVEYLRLNLKRYQVIDFKKFFPSLRELSYNIQQASLTQTRDFFASVENIQSLFIVCPRKFELPESSFQSLTRLSLNFKAAVSPNIINWVGNHLPNLCELSVKSDKGSFENFYLETKCCFVSLMRFVSPDQLSSKFWEKLTVDAPKLVDIHIFDWLKMREEIGTICSRITVSPFYVMEENTFPDFAMFY